jgi:hypothetical protein
MNKWSLIVTGLILIATMALPVQADIAVRLIGTAEADDLSESGEAAVNAFFDDPSLAKGRSRSDFLCYELPLEDLESGAVIGTGVDCLRIFDAVADDTPGVTIPLSPQIDAVTFFLLPGGSWASDGLTSVRPFFQGVGDGDGAVTHITGSFPPDNGPGSIVTGSGDFAGASGNTRLSGAVNLTDFFSDGNPIFFSCLFVSKFGPPASATANGRPLGN